MSSWASEHLEVIRTLMERAAVYRRALAPVALLAGLLGAVAGAVGYFAGIDSPRGFGIYWMAVGLVSVASAFLLIRRQSLRDVEAFWSPPTRRVVQALLPPLTAGVVAGILMVIPRWREPLQVWWLPPVWMVLYGCALHAAGFFMPRGIRLFGWCYLGLGCVLLAVLNQRQYAAGMPSLANAHWLMAACFGGLHLAYGMYLSFTEPRRNAA